MPEQVKRPNPWKKKKKKKEKTKKKKDDDEHKMLPFHYASEL
jgi:hypothetical protein